MPQVLAEVLIAVILLFAVAAYGAVEPCAVVVTQWGVLALALVTVVRWVRGEAVALPRSWLHLPLLVLAAAAFASIPGSIYPYGSVREVSRVLSYVAMAYLAAMNLRTPGAIHRLLVLLVVVGALLPFAGFTWDWTTGPAASRAVVLSTSFSTGTFPNENHFAAFLAMALPLGVGLAASFLGHRRWVPAAGMGVCVALMAAWLMETLTRAAWLGVTAALVLSAAVVGLARGIRGEGKAWAGVAVVTALLLALGLAPERSVEQVRMVVNLGDTDTSMAFRWAAWQDALQVVRRTPWLGTGAGTFDLAFATSRRASMPFPGYVDFLHNDYLQYTLEMGLWAGAALVLVVLLTASGLARGALRRPDAPGFPLALALMAGLFGFAVALVYSFELYVTANGLVFFALVGTAWVMAHRFLRDDETTEGTTPAR